MANPLTVLGQFALDAEQLFTGRTSDVWILEGGFLPTTPSFFPVHGLSLNGVPAKPAVSITRRFTGGVTGIAYVKTITVTAFGNLVAGTSTLTVGSKTYTFVSGAPVGDQIQIGTDNATTATNIRNKIFADLVTSELQSAVVSTNVVTLTGLATGATFALSTNAPTALTLATTVTGVAEVKAFATIQSVGSRHKTGTISQIVLIQTISGLVERVRYQFDTPSDSTTNAQIATGLKTCLENALSNLPQAAGSRVISTNPLNTGADIAASLVTLFGTTASFTLPTTDTLKLTVATPGADGNNQAITVSTLNSVPSPTISIDTNGVPQVDGIAIHMGGQSGFQCVVNPQTVDVNVSNIRERFKRITTGETLDINFKLVQDDNLEFAGFSINRATITFTDSSTFLMFGGSPITQTFAMIFTSPSPRIGGAYDVLVIYNCEPSALTISRDRQAITGFDVKLSPNGFNRQGDPVGYIQQVRVLT